MKVECREKRSSQIRTFCVREGVAAAFGIVTMLALTIIMYRYATKDVGVAKQGYCDDATNACTKNVDPSLPRADVACSSEIASKVVLQRQCPVTVGEDELSALSERGLKGEHENARIASGENQIMDALLDRPHIPDDYADVMIGLYRDKTQDVVKRDFAVQHIGHYALALNRRGQYDADSAEANILRSAQFSLSRVE